MTGWYYGAVTLDPAPDTVHAIPLGDLIEHTDEDCVCGPSTIPVLKEDGSFWWKAIHHSLDGRERHG